MSKMTTTKREQLRAELSAPIKWFGCPNCGYGPCGCEESNERLESERRRTAVDLFALIRSSAPGPDDAADLALVKRLI